MTSSNALHRSPEVILKFLSAELSVQGEYKDAKSKRSEGGDGGDVKATLRGTHSEEVLREKLDDFIELFLLCPRCDNPDSGMLVTLQKKRPPELHYNFASCGCAERYS